jgi:WD40 repeat protein
MTSEEVSLLKRWIDEGASAGSNAMPTKGRETPVEWKSLDASIQSTYAVDVAADGSWLAAGRGATVVVVDIATGETRATLMGHQDIVQSLAISPDGHRIAIGGFEEVHVWARRAGEPAHAHWDGPTRWKAGRDRVTALAFSPDGSMLAGSTGVPTSGGTITLWRSDGTIAQTLTDVHSDSITSLAFSPDGQWLASGSADKFLKVHSVSEKKTPRNFEGHTGYVLDVAWRADGLTLATASADKTIKIWSVETGEQVRTIGGHTGEITGLSYLADTATLATSCSDRVGRLVNSDNGNIDKVLEGASNYLVSLAASKDGKLIAAGTPSGHIHLWTSDGKPPRTVEPAPAANVSSAK